VVPRAIATQGARAARGLEATAIDQGPILVLYWWHDRSEMRRSVERHLHAVDHVADEVVYVNADRADPDPVRERSYAGVLLHTTFLWLRCKGKFDRYRRAWSWLRDLDCPKIALPQDEFNHSAALDEWLDELGVDHVFSNFDEPAQRLLYPRTFGRARFSVALTGYIDEDAAAYCRTRAHPLAERPLDVVYRTAPARFWLGRGSLLKTEIGSEVLSRAERHGLDVDISTKWEDTIYGDAWLDFLLSGRATLGAESGSSVLDRRGEVRARVEELLDRDPSLTYDELDASMPPGWDAYAFFAIAPRHLEAIVARTPQILVEGSYSGVLEPGRHFISVRRDYSDLDDALERLRDVRYLEELATRAYDEVYLPGRWTLDAFGRQLREAFEDAPQPGLHRQLRAAVARLHGR